ncbi:MAG: type 4a pilus biogenesis protein PilO [Balneolaceae bacterium]
MSSYHKYGWKIASGTVLLIAIALIYVAVLPYLSLSLEKYQVLRSQQQSIDFIVDWKKELANLEEKKKVLASSLQKVQEGVPSAQDFPKVIEMIFKTGQNSGILIERIQPKADEKGKFNKKTLQLEIKGDYHKIAHFVNKLEQGAFQIRIIGIELGTSTKDELISGKISLVVTTMMEA